MPLFASKRQRFISRYGPWAVVTGASSGIGRACAAELARRGLNVVLVGRDAERLASTKARVETLGAQTRSLAIDLGQAGASETLAASTDDLDVGLLVAAAGYGDAGAFLEGDPEVLVDMLRVNAEAVLVQSLLFGRRFASRGRGGLILFGSLVGRQGTPYAAAYAATKGYAQLLGEGLAAELRPAGVDVVVSAPGPVATGFGARARLRLEDADTAEAVAADTLSALGRRVVVPAGPNSRRLTAALSLAPRGVRTRILGGVMRRMSLKETRA